jgi:hypothetical protein
MTDEVLSYDRIESAMVSAMNKLEKCTADYAVATDAYAVAEADHRYAYSLARNNARAECRATNEKYSEKLGDDFAILATHDEYLVAEKAKAVQDACRQALLSTRSRLEALRSLMTSHREMTR